MKKGTCSKYRGITCTEENLREYGNKAFAVFWKCTKNEPHIIFCKRIIVKRSYTKYFAAVDSNNEEIRTFVINDEDAWILIEK